MNDLFAVCAPGLEAASRAELEEFGVEVGSPETGGVPFRATVEEAARLHLRLRTVVRVLMRLGSFEARGRSALAAGLASLPLRRYRPAGVRVACRKSKLTHTGLVADAVRAASGGLEGAGGELYVRIDRDVCTVSVDMSGERLGRRGWRTDVGPAPLRESVAAALLREAGWAPGETLLDPMCGSGVFALEAADRALGLCAGRGRRFAWEAWLDVRPPVGVPPDVDDAPAIFASDRRPEALEAARAHAAAAGLEGVVGWSVTELSEVRAPDGPPPGLVVCNPPWGRRLETGQVYLTLGRTLRRLKGWRAAVVAPRGDAVSDLEGALGRGPERVVPFRHGGQPVALRLYAKLGVRARSRRRRADRPRRRGGLP